MTIVLLALALPTNAQAEAADFEETGAIVAGSNNSLNPFAGCDKAKKDAREKATKAGYAGQVERAHLSVDSNCSLRRKGLVE